MPASIIHVYNPMETTRKRRQVKAVRRKWEELQSEKLSSYFTYQSYYLAKRRSYFQEALKKWRQPNEPGKNFNC